MMNRGGYPPMNRMGAGMRTQRPQRGGGGFLAKLLGKGGEQAGMSNPFSSFPSRAANRSLGSEGGGGILKALTDPNTINGFLTNTQKVLNTAGQFGPMVQQYGPLVRNLPSLWKLYKGFKDLPDASEEGTSQEVAEESTVQEVAEEVSEKQQENSTKKSKTKSKTTPTPKQAQKRTGQSVPKLYI